MESYFCAGQFVVSVTLGGRIYLIGCADRDSGIPAFTTFTDEADYKKFVRKVAKIFPIGANKYSRLLTEGKPKMHPIESLENSVVNSREGKPIDIVTLESEVLTLTFIECTGETACRWRENGMLIRLPKNLKKRTSENYTAPDIEEKLRNGISQWCCRSSAVH